MPGGSAAETSSVPMRLLIDENVPDSVAAFFRDRGHEINLVREVLLPGMPDPLVALAADTYSMIVVTWNKRDFDKLVKRVPAGNRNKFRRAGMICFSCSEPLGVKRLEKVIRLIELEYELVQAEKDHRLIAYISTNDFRCVR
jgi:predicted nuclease of predicted toxin-antitoxin system